MGSEVVNKNVVNNQHKLNLNGSNEQKRMEAKKRNDIPNGAVFATVNGVTAMHKLDKVELHVGEFNGTLGDFIELILERDSKREQDFQKYKEEVNQKLQDLQVAKILD